MKQKQLIKELGKIAGSIFVAFFALLGCYAFVILETTDPQLQRYTLLEIQEGLTAHNFMMNVLLTCIGFVIGGYVLVRLFHKLQTYPWKKWKSMNKRRKKHAI